MVPAVERIALLLESDGPGGAEKMLLHLAEYLRNRGYEVCPVGPASGCGWLASEFRALGFEPEVFRLRRPLDATCVRELATLFRDRGIQLAHSHEFTMAVYGAAAANLAGAAHVVTMHGGKHATATWRRRSALRWAFGRSQAVVAVSEAVRSDLRAALGSSGRRVDVVHNGIAWSPGNAEKVRRELALSDDELLILAVGNLYAVKGHAYLVEALATVTRTRPDLRWRLAIAGQATFGGEVEAESRALTQIAARAGFADRLHMLGHRADVPDLLAAADIFVLPSLSEGLPLALLEAMFAGTAIIASAVGGVPEAVRHRSEAWLCPPADAGAIAAAIIELADNPQLRRRLGEVAARRAHRQFHRDAMASRYEDVYDRAARIVAGRRSPAVARLFKWAS